MTVNMEEKSKFETILTKFIHQSAPACLSEPLRF